jgi:endogenous inhibitor of DNA gyrase (YacG/DUF329 family)
MPCKTCAVHKTAPGTWAAFCSPRRCGLIDAGSVGRGEALPGRPRRSDALHNRRFLAGVYVNNLQQAFPSA